MGISQPTLSLQVKALEERYDVKLLERAGRGVRLTAFGEELLQATTRLFASADEVEDILDGGRDLTTGAIHLGATGPGHIVPMMQAFRERYPGVRLSLFIRNAEQLLDALRERRIDVAQISFPPHDDDLLSIPITVDPMVLCVGKDHRWAGRKSVPLADIVEESLVLREPGTATRNVLDRAFADSGLEPAHVMDIFDWEAARDLIAANLGVSIMSTADARDDPRLVQIPVKGKKLEMPEHLLFFSERRRIMVVRAFLDVAEEVIAGKWA